MLCRCGDFVSQDSSDLVWTFPRLGHKCSSALVPKDQSPAAQAAAVAGLLPLMLMMFLMVLALWR